MIILILAAIALPGHGPQLRGYQAISRSKMNQIALALVLYRDDHKGSYPQRLSLLFPDYIPAPQCFYIPNKYNSAFTPLNAFSDPKLIDAFSAYGFSELGDGRSIIFERAVSWSDRTIGFVLFSDPTKSTETPLSPNRLSQEEFAMQYAKSFKP